jgi:predicted GNAT family acetyltransferase
MVIMHTVVPLSARGKGLGSLLVKFVLDHVRAHNLKVIIYCPFTDKYVKDHPEYQDLVYIPETK